MLTVCSVALNVNVEYHKILLQKEILIRVFNVKPVNKHEFITRTC